MKIYIAGPMRSKPYYNFPAFDAARNYYRALGHADLRTGEAAIWPVEGKA